MNTYLQNPMRSVRIILLLTLILLVPKFSPYTTVAISAVDRVWSDFKLPQNDLDFRTQTRTIEALHKPVGEPRPGDWRATTIQPEQSFSQYVLGGPIRPDENRNTLYIQPLGSFTERQQEIVSLTAEFMELYFCCPVELLPSVSADVVPQHARRIHPHGQEQFLASWIHTEFLKPRLPDDAVACLALTATDLWPGRNWNFVFGQASLVNRVGVWSMARLGDPEQSYDASLQCLRRTLRTATHETGHMFSIRHCVYYECNMAGMGSLAESDRHPLFLCPECLAKLHWSVRPDPANRLKNLASFCRQNGLLPEFQYYSAAQSELKQDRNSTPQRTTISQPVDHR